IKQGDDLLTSQKYTDAYVKYQKASLLQVDNEKAESRQKLAKDSAKDISVLKQFAGDNNYVDLSKLISDASSKICKPDIDRTLIENNLSGIAVINLKFCLNDGPKDYQNGIFLGLAYLHLANDSHMFSEFKPDFRLKAVDAFAKAYTIDPINKTALEDLVSTEKIIGDTNKVDYWQNLLDNLNKISE
ncbi:MAG: hypothetical protein WCP91_03480, partial [Candidatus Berkelbacteria bacterium]